MHTMYGFGSSIFSQLNDETNDSVEKDRLDAPVVLNFNCKCKIENQKIKRNETECEGSDWGNDRIPLSSCVKEISISWYSILIRTDDGTLQYFGLDVPIKTHNVSLVEQLADDIIYTDFNTKGDCWIQKNEDLCKVNINAELEKSKDRDSSQKTISDDELCHITQVSSTDTCAILCLANGKVCKLSRHVDDKEGENIPQCSFTVYPISCSLPISQVSCGKEHTVMLSKFGDILTFGSNSRGQLGNGKVDVGAVETPGVLEALSGVVITEVKAGGWHTVALSDIGDIYSWGWNESGQLGLGLGTTQNSGETPINLQPTPTLVETIDEITFVSVACGSRHTVGLTDTGDVYTWGCNQHGQLGHGDMKTKYYPTKVQFFNEHTVCQIFAGSWNTLVVTQEKAKEES